MRSLLICLAVLVLSATLAARPGRAAAHAQAASARIARPLAAAQRVSAARHSAPGSWIGALGGLALGGLFGALSGGRGFGGLATFITIAALLGYAGFTLYRLSRRQERPSPVVSPPAALAALARPAPAAAPPADPERDAALAAAKLGFVKLQLAEELGRLDLLRDLVTPAALAELQPRTVGSRAQGGREITALAAELLEVAAVGDTREARVRLSGTRGAAGEAAAFREIWHLAQARDASGRWLLARIEPAS